jgi:hypothetical protein
MKVTLYITPRCSFGETFLKSFNETTADLDFDAEIEMLDPSEAFKKGDEMLPFISN